MIDLTLLRLIINDRGDGVRALHGSLRLLGYFIPKHERDEEMFGVGTQAALLEFQARSNLPPTGMLDAATRAALAAANSGAAGEEGRVEGRVFFSHGMPAAGLGLRLYRRDFGGAASPLGETTTDERGYYLIRYTPVAGPLHLEVRAATGAGREVPVSETKFNAERREVWNLIAPADVRPLAPEYERLFNSLERQLGDLSRLSQAQETPERRDITFLHQSTGWDARVIALAATASRLSDETRIPREALYALFREGLPTDRWHLAQVSPAAFESALVKAGGDGIVKLDRQQIANARAAFESFATTARLETKAPWALSSAGDMLNAGFLLGAEGERFGQLYFAHRGTSEELWTKAAALVPTEKVEQLRLQGKLAFLTLNNGPLTESLRRDLGSAENLRALVDRDFYRGDAWEAQLNNMAGGSEQALQQLIPPAYADVPPAERLKSYAEDLARKVRLSYPTRVVARMVEKGDLPLGDAGPSAGKNAGAFLRKAEGLGFELGRAPVEAFVRQNASEVFEGIPDGERAATTAAVKSLQRLYQITPSDDSLRVSLDLGLKSAHDVVAFAPEEFFERFGSRYASLDEARLVYARAQQVTAVTHSFFGAARQVDSAPPLHATSPPPARREQVRDELIRRYPTMESLFGSLDYCECEHCRSVLSPAAYFVDLLQFVNADDLVWRHFLEAWPAKHNGESYGPGYKKPFDALVRRRPDLPHLPLTCENTNTAMPYIDLVNEILEYFVAHDGLSPQSVRDTGDSKMTDLLAEPQNVVAAAYDKLKSERYPLTLPFDLWLETVRRFLGYFETPLWRVLELFRQADELYAPRRDAKPYYRAAIFAEYLGLSPDEYEVLTAHDPAAWFRLYGYADAGEALCPVGRREAGGTAACTHLSGGGSPLHELPGVVNAKVLARRLGVTYAELTEVVRTGFVNPKLDALSLLGKLRLDLGDVTRYFADRGKPEYAAEEAAVEERLRAFEVAYDLAAGRGRAELEKLRATGALKDALLLRDFSGLCNFDQTFLQFADGRDADGATLLKLNLFVRLRRTLGWTVEETDRALLAFLPSALAPPSAANLGRSLKSALLGLAHLKALGERVGAGAGGRLKLLTLWTRISTAGKGSLYAGLFLTPGVLRNDPFFDDPFGDYLSGASVPVKDHLLALQGALGLTADELRLTLAESDAGRALAAGRDVFEVPLTLDTVSLLYRHGLLARGLKLSVRELIALKNLSGLDPFKPLGADPVARLADDFPLVQTLAFVEAAEKVRASGFRVEDLDYLLRHNFDSAGKYRPDEGAFQGLLKTLDAGLRRIRAEHSDASAQSDEALRGQLPLVLTPEVSETFFGMLNGTVEYEARQAGVAPEAKLDPADFASEPSVRVGYDELRRTQTLVFRGVLLEDEKRRLKGAHTSPVFGSLLDAAQAQAQGFFAKHLAVFFAAGDYERLFAPLPAALTDAQRQEALRVRRGLLARAFLPVVREGLSRRFVVQTLAAGLGADPSLTEALLTNSTLLANPDLVGKPLVASFTPAGERGVSATFYASADATGAPLAPTRTLADADAAAKPAGTNSARFGGYLEVPAAGAYRFYALAGKARAAVVFRLDGQPVIRFEAAADGAEASQFVELKPGRLYEFNVEALNLQEGSFSLLVQGETTPKEGLGRLTLYPRAPADGVRRAHTLLSKALKLVQGLGLGEREVRHILTHKADFDNLDLSRLPLSSSHASAAALFGQFLRLADYARLKRELGAGPEDLVPVLENARRAHPVGADPAQAERELFDDLTQRLAELTRRDVAAVRATAMHLGFAARHPSAAAVAEASDFAQEKGLWRLWEALRVIEKLGVPAESLVRATGVVTAGVTQEKRAAVARELKNSVKARFDAEGWRQVARSLFDALRGRQRDALVAYVLRRLNFQRVEQLFEYFLIDPATEPMVQTSRLRLAISSVQLFIQRCLLNLEPDVPAAALNSKRWQWMKRYRVWEANRKIFLFPENWLEPELRDDKSHLFRELESALLQGDASDELAEDVFFRYLKRLEELARLEIMTMYAEEDEHDAASNVLHVVGRTYGQPHKYFYRRYQHQTWTPWEPVTAEIEGDHLVAVVWRSRLHLFWVTFMEKEEGVQDESKSPRDLAETPVSGQKPPRTVEVQLNWTEYFQGEWKERVSSGFLRTSAVITDDFRARNVSIAVIKGMSGYAGDLMIHLGNPVDRSFWLPNKHTPPVLMDWDAPGTPPYGPGGADAARHTYDGVLNVSFAETIKTTDGGSPTETRVEKDILSTRDGQLYSLLFPSNAFPEGGDDIKGLVTPFFYQDREHTFYVEPTLTEKTFETWDDWIIPGAWFNAGQAGDNWLNLIPVEPLVPVVNPLIVIGLRPDDPLINPVRDRAVTPTRDWVTHPATLFEFGGQLIGATGGILQSASKGLAAGGTNVLLAGGGASRAPIDANKSSGLAALNGGGNHLAAAVSVVGGAGLTATLLQNLGRRGGGF